MSKWIDADNLHNAKFQDISGYGENVAYRVGWNDAIDAICENEPSIDIVRCRECEHGTWHEQTEMYICSANDQDLYEAEHFCSYGERREP